MSTTTPKLGLKKPSGGDYVDVNDLNDNFDKLDNAIMSTGGIMTGALKLHSGTGEIDATTTDTRITARNSGASDTPKREFVIRNFKNSTLQDALKLIDYTSASTTDYRIFGEHNMGNLANNPNNISTYTHLNQLGLTDSDFSSTDFSANFTKLLNAMPTHARLVCTTSINFKNALVAKIVADTGFSHDDSATFVINVTKTGSGIYQIASLRANEMYSSYVGREYSVFRYISKSNVTTDTPVIFTSSTDGGFASRLKRSYNTLAQIGLSDAIFTGKTFDEAVEVLYNALGDYAELMLNIESSKVPNLFNILREKINTIPFGNGGSLSANGQVGLRINTSPYKYRTHILELFPDANAFGTGIRCSMKALFEYSTNTGLTVSPLIIDYDPNGFVSKAELATMVQSLMESGDISMLMSPVSIKNYSGSGTRTGTGKGKIYLGCVTTASYSNIVIDGKDMGPSAIETYYGSVEIDFTTSFSIRCDSSNCSITAVFY